MKFSCKIDNMVEGVTGQSTGWNVHDATCSVDSNTLEQMSINFDSLLEKIRIHHLYMAIIVFSDTVPK